MRTLWISYLDRECAASAFQNLFSNVLPWTEGADIKKEDAVIFSGGVDIDPAIYGEEMGAMTQQPNKMRDERERIVFRRAQAAGAACIGVCRGAQFLCAVSGGKLIQHVTGHTSTTHNILLDLQAEANDDWMDILFPSAGDHHQMMWPHSVNNHVLLAYSKIESKIYCDYGKQLVNGRQPEVVWFPDTRSLCIQGHPEWEKEKAVFPRYCNYLVRKLILGVK